MDKYAIQEEDQRSDTVPPSVHTVSIVVPIFNGASTIAGLMSEIEPLTHTQTSAQGVSFRVEEVLLVWDGGSSATATALREMENQYQWAHVIWLSRNFGQHAATLAGMSSTSGEWVVTLDEDGQHDPNYIGQLLDCALANSVQLVYASPSDGRPHGVVRNLGSHFARWLFSKLVGDTNINQFHSFRLILGEVARGTAAYTGPGVYLDVALSWVVASSSTTPIPMRAEGRSASNYSLRKLIAHFGRLIISSGTRPLAIVSGLGFLFFMLGIILSIWVLFQRFFANEVPQGWTSSFVATLVIGGLILLSLGVIAQYLKSAVDMSLGKPLYVVVQDPLRHFSDQSPDNF